MSKHIAIYSRCSTDQQTTASQDRELELWAANQSEPVRWYRDSATGKNNDRPGWIALEAALARGEVSRVVCWRLDRLGRRVRLLAAFLDDLQARGVGLLSLRENLDLSTPAGRMMFGVIASVAQYETELRGERVAAGQAAAKAKGKTWGGRQSGTMNKATADKAAAVETLASQGHAIASIAKSTGLSRPTVYRLLRS